MKKPLIKICLLDAPSLIDSEVMPVPKLGQEPVTMDKCKNRWCLPQSNRSRVQRFKGY
jgi:hypothetical protein